MQRYRKSSVGRAWYVPLIAAAAALCAGCSSKPKAQPTEIQVQSEASTNAQALDASFTQQTRNGVATGRTIYPHDFIIGDIGLTLVGQRNFNALLPRNDVAPVRVNVPRGGVSEPLYTARLDVLRQHFANAGYGEDRYTFVDELPAGEGISSDRVLLLATEEPRPKQGTRPGRSGAMNSTSGQSAGGGGRNTGGGSSSGGGGSGGYSR